jgi:hypothetical protein
VLTVAVPLLVGLPSCPYMLLPQQYAAPAGVSAQVWLPPAARVCGTRETVIGDGDGDGTGVGVVDGIGVGVVEGAGPGSEEDRSEMLLPPVDEPWPGSTQPDAAASVAATRKASPARTLNSLMETTILHRRRATRWFD